MITVLIRTLIIYLFLIFAMRLSGKRQIGELQISELVTALLLSEIASMPIGHDEIPLTFAIIPLTAVICLEIISAFAVTKSPILNRILGGSPGFLIKKGRLNKKELARCRITLDELISEARLNGVSDISTLYYAVLESNGKLSVFPKAKVGEKEKGIAHAIIADGTINTEELKETELSRSALDELLKKKALSADNVFLLTVDDAGEQYWILKKER